jgi:hypothetical protein
MHFPKYWRLASARGTGRDGQPVVVDAWGWSDDGEAAAAAHGAQRARAAVERRIASPELRIDWYYDRRPLREEVLREVRADDGTVIAAVTRSRAGPMVLNTARVMFVDIDFPAREAVRPSFWRRLSGAREAAAEAFPLGCAAEQRASDAVRGWVATRHDFGLRLYRTARGLRCLVTHAEFDTAASRPLLEEMGADRRYAILCVSQQCYRARLTAKPWRVGVPRYGGKRREEDLKALKHREIWLARYEVASAQVAVCRFLGDVGSMVRTPAAARVIAEHDRATRALEAQLLLA